jgi:hypothetical protein
MNNTKVFILLAGMMALFGVVGQASTEERVARLRAMATG